MTPWHARVHHDLVKRALWPARDLREVAESGKTASSADLRALRDGLFSLQGDQGSPTDARALWARLRMEAPPEVTAAALESFGAGVDSAMNVVGHAVPASGATVSAGVVKDAVEAVLALQRLFEALKPVTE